MNSESADSEPVASKATVPLFPLSNVFLFPGTVMPFRIFEDRYRQMVEDMLDGPGRFVVGTVVPGHEAELPGSPPVHPIAGLGEIGRHERLESGEFILFVIGVQRVRLREVDSERLYRKVEVEPVQETLPAPGVTEELRPQIVSALKGRAKAVEAPLESLPLGQLADLLLLQMGLPGERTRQIYSQTDIETRARECLSESSRLPPTSREPEDE